MDPRLFEYYGKELQYLRTVGAEFAREFPKVAQRLSLEEFECKDPYVERLLEGFAFLTARIQLKLDSEFPHFTQQLLEVLYPSYIAPVPSMAVVEFALRNDAYKPSGLRVERGAKLNGAAGRDDRTSCDYVVSQALHLWPLQIKAVDYLDSATGVANCGVKPPPGTRSGLRLGFQILGGITADKLEIEGLPLFLTGAAPTPALLFELVHAAGLGCWVGNTGGTRVWHERSVIERMGWGADENLLPDGTRSFSGYRLLREYFAMPERFQFLKLTGVGEAIRSLGAVEQFEIVIPLQQVQPRLAGSLELGNVRLNCAPVINLFPIRADRVSVDVASREHRVIVDKTRPLDFEVYSIEGIEGYGADSKRIQRFEPFYGPGGQTAHEPGHAYFSARREGRVLSSRERDKGARANYHGSEVFVSLIDHRERPFSSSVEQLGVQVMATNRDLALHLPVGRGETDFQMASGMAMRSIRCVVGPTRPIPAITAAESVWRAISFLSLGYLSLVESEGDADASGLRELLSLHSADFDRSGHRQIEGIREIRARPITRRIPAPGPVMYGRGLQLDVLVDDTAFEGHSPYLMGCVLEDFFSRLAGINSFTETVLRTLSAGEVGRWPARMGRCPIL